MNHFEPVLSRFRALADDAPDAPTYSFVDERGELERRLDRRALIEQVDSISGFVRQRCGLEPGARALLLYAPSMDFVLSFIGCHTGAPYQR